MKYRPCLWCREYFWAPRTEVCCCPEHQAERRKEKEKKRKAKLKVRMEKALEKAKGKA